MSHTENTIEVNFVLLEQESCYKQKKNPHHKIPNTDILINEASDAKTELRNKYKKCTYHSYCTVRLLVYKLVLYVISLFFGPNVLNIVKQNK